MSSSEDHSEHKELKKPTKSTLKPISTALGKKQKRRGSSEEDMEPKTKKSKKTLKKEVKELEKDHQESLFYREKKPNPVKEEKAPPRRGHLFTDAEIMYMLALLYAGFDNNTCCKRYFEKYPASSRTPSSLKSKFAWLRTDALAKIGGVPAEKIETHDDALDFLTPSFVSHGEDFYYLFAKSPWLVTFGFKGNQIRVLLTQERKLVVEDRSTALWREGIFDGVSSFIHIMEIDSNMEIVGSYEDAHYKGVQLRLKPLNQAKQDDGWNMK